VMSEAALDPADEDRLPWLEAVEEDEEDGVSLVKLVAGVLGVLLLIALFVGGYFWMRGPAGSPDGIEIIAAPDEDYRVRPSEAGGMEVEGEGDAAFAASEGGSPEGRIDRSAVPEPPVQGRRIAEGSAPATGSSTARIPANDRPLAESAPQQPAPAATTAAVNASSGRLVQLGAFSSEAAANSAWAQISGRHGSLRSLSRTVTPVQAGGRTLYRLRAAASSRDAARSLCAGLRNAGQACSVVVN